MRVGIAAADLAPQGGLSILERARRRLFAASSGLRFLEIRGDAPSWGPPTPGLLQWGDRLANGAGRAGTLTAGWAGGLVRGPALELLLACDLLFLGPRAAIRIFPPTEGYTPVAGSLLRAARRVPGGGLLCACLEATEIRAGRAVDLGLATEVVEAAGLARVGRALLRNDDRALGAVADLARRGPGLGDRQAEALERAVFAWCFAGGRPRRRLRSFRGDGTDGENRAVSPRREADDE
ncbi:MAG: hypothetical protein PVF68_01840 [Acidobacteriota bacterium]